ncbi:hypothetical protein [Streptomyces sp. NPDC001970]
MEGFSRTLAAQLGPHGVRVICLRSAGSVESMPDVLERRATRAGVTRDEFVAFLADRTLLKRLPSLADVADVADVGNVEAPDCAGLRRTAPVLSPGRSPT